MEHVAQTDAATQQVGSAAVKRQARFEGPNESLEMVHITRGQILAEAVAQLPGSQSTQGKYCHASEGQQGQ